MYDIFHKIQNILVKFLIILLILIISTQIIIKNEYAKNNLLLLKNNLEYKINKMLLNKDMAIEVISNKNIDEIGIMKIKTVRNLSLPKAYILRNNKRASNFSNGEAVIEIHNGDLISLDTRAYEQRILFEIEYLSNNISSLSAGYQYATNGNIMNITRVFFNNDKI